MNTINIGDPETVQVLEELNHSRYYDRITSKYADQMSPYLRLDHDWLDTLLHYNLGEWLIFGLGASYVFGNPNDRTIGIYVVFSILAIFLLAIPSLRASAWRNIELTLTEIRAFNHTFQWKEIEKINVIRTTKRYPKQGIQLILLDQTVVNIDLALRKPHIGNRNEMLAYIYLFWRRGNEDQKKPLPN